MSMFICSGTIARYVYMKIEMNPKVSVFRCINFFLNTEVLKHGYKVVAQPLFEIAEGLFLVKFEPDRCC